MHLPGSFPVLLQLGHVGDSGRCARSAWCWASPERSSRELLSSEARGWHQEPAGFGKSLSAGVSGAPGREMLLAGAGGHSCSGQQGAVDVQRAWGGGCPHPTLLQGKPDVLGGGPETPAQAREGLPPHSQLWGL